MTVTNIFANLATYIFIHYYLNEFHVSEHKSNLADVYATFVFYLGVQYHVLYNFYTIPFSYLYYVSDLSDS